MDGGGWLEGEKIISRHSSRLQRSARVLEDLHRLTAIFTMVLYIRRFPFLDAMNYLSVNGNALPAS